MRSLQFSAGILFVSLLALAGCNVQVDKSKNGDDKNVRIDTPLGGLHVRSDQTTASDLGLPIYPGARVSPDKDGDKSADVHLGFGKWQMRVKVVTYQSPDSQDKVLAFYRGAMSRFGDVIQCDGNRAVGQPTVTADGLTCSEDQHGKVHVSGVSDNEGLSLRAGSRHHQHIFAIKNSGSSGTTFALVELQLPADLDKGSPRTSD